MYTRDGLVQSMELIDEVKPCVINTVIKKKKKKYCIMFNFFFDFTIEYNLRWTTSCRISVHFS